MLEPVYADWYRCPNCQAAYTLVDGDVCPDCGRLIEREKYPQDAESIYQHGKRDQKGTNENDTEGR